MLEEGAFRKEVTSWLYVSESEMSTRLASEDTSRKLAIIVLR